MNQEDTNQNDSGQNQSKSKPEPQRPSNLSMHIAGLISPTRSYRDCVEDAVKIDDSGMDDLLRSVRLMLRLESPNETVKSSIAAALHKMGERQ